MRKDMKYLFWHIQQYLHQLESCMLCLGSNHPSLPLISILVSWSSRFMKSGRRVLKNVSKSVTLIVRFVNVFPISHLMHVISIFMDSKHYADYFQLFFVPKMEKFTWKMMTNTKRMFKKQCFDWHNWYSTNL